MAKIRSTLDIVLERTKDLALTPEQKANLRCEEWTLKSRGLLQRYLAGTLTASALRTELARGKQECPELEGILKGEFIQAFDPQGDYQTVADGLQAVLGIDPAPYIERLKGFTGKLTEEQRAQRKRKLSDLSRRGIGGTAVLPNLEADEVWQALKAELRAELGQELLAL